MRVTLIQKFLQLEAAGGLMLFAAALMALLWANSPYAYIHQQFIDTFLFTINEGLMALFFLLMGLELKRGFLSGQLSSWSQIALPGVAAIGGMLLPALIYIIFNWQDPITLRGWATPVATDIAFALGALSLFGKRVPVALKLFLLALAIFDDLGAILIIAFFYAKKLSYLYLFQAIVLSIILYLMNRLSVRALIPYLIIGVWLWVALLFSGIHPTIAGVIVAFAIPASGINSPLQQLETKLHPWVVFCIMPLFALANAGFSLGNINKNALMDPIVLGITLGLFIGKQLGVFGFSYGLVRTRWVKLPNHASWLEVYGVALLCGIGFTMSLFLGTLAFENNNVYLAEVRLGVIMGSILSGVMGALVLLGAFARKRSSIVD